MRWSPRELLSILRGSMVWMSTFRRLALDFVLVLLTFLTLLLRLGRLCSPFLLELTGCRLPGSLGPPGRCVGGMFWTKWWIESSASASGYCAYDAVEVEREGGGRLAASLYVSCDLSRDPCESDTSNGPACAVLRLLLMPDSTRSFL